VVCIANPPAGEKRARLRKRNPGTFVHTITQEDLEKALQLMAAIGEAKRAYSEHMQFLEQARRSGAQIEPGLYELLEVIRRGGGVEVPAWEKPGVRIVKKKAS